MTMASDVWVVFEGAKGFAYKHEENARAFHPDGAAVRYVPGPTLPPEQRHKDAADRITAAWEPGENSLAELIEQALADAEARGRAEAEAERDLCGVDTGAVDVCPEHYQAPAPPKVDIGVCLCGHRQWAHNGPGFCNTCSCGRFVPKGETRR